MFIVYLKFGAIPQLIFPVRLLRVNKLNTYPNSSHALSAQLISSFNHERMHLILLPVQRSHSLDAARHLVYCEGVVGVSSQMGESILYFSWVLDKLGKKFFSRVKWYLGVQSPQLRDGRVQFLIVLDRRGLLLLYAFKRIKKYCSWPKLSHFETWKMVYLHSELNDLSWWKLNKLRERILVLVGIC